MDPILGMLSTKEPISGERLCEQLGMTRAAVWKRMEKLRAEGYRIVSAGKLGYRLDPEENSLLPGYLLHELDTRWAGRGEIAYEAKMDSTNIRAKELARSGAPSGSLALCDQQTAGRGRLQRRWETPAGVALTQSLVLRPSLPTEQAQLFTLAAALAAAGAIAQTCPGLDPGIKWPNDVILNGKKCVGILSELAADMDGLSLSSPAWASTLTRRPLMASCARRRPRCSSSCERPTRTPRRSAADSSCFPTCAIWKAPWTRWSARDWRASSISTWPGRSRWAGA